MPSVEGRTLGDLPDVNVWIALLNPQHTHHERAKQYWERSAAQSIGLCRTTMLGLLRLCTNKAVMGGTPYTSEQAWTAYQSLIDLPEVVFFAEPPGIDAAMRRHCAHPLFRTADWTDADKNFPDVDLTPEFKAQAKIDCRHFIQQVYEIPASENFDWGQVGQDFWLTRNGHGAGFRDRPEMYDGRPNAERLDKIARAFGVHYAEFL